MSKLDELVQELCPDGVYYSIFGDVVNYEQPTRFIVNNTNYCDDYKTPVLTAGQTFILGYTNEAEGIYPASKENPVIIFDDFTGAFKWVDFPFKAKSSAMKILTADNTKTTLRYIYHVMGNIGYISNEHKRLWISVYSNFRLPLPPLPVQREIVRILDNFTELTTELSAELVARKKQYEFYRDKLLSFDVHGGALECERRTLGDICNLKAGKAISASEISLNQTPEYFIPCFGGNGLRGYVRVANQRGDKILIGRQGALCGNVRYVTGDYYVTEHAVVVTNKEYFNSRFLYHMLTYKDLNQYKTAGAQPGLSVTRLESIIIPVPNRTLQNKIAYVLDNFETICSDLNIGLPAEIEARKKQYEFYRDALLTYVETGKIIDQIRSDQIKSNQIKSNQIKSNQIKSNNYITLIKLCQYIFGYISLPLGEIATILRGGNFQKKDFLTEGVSCIHYGQIYTRYDLFADKTFSFISEECAKKQKTAHPNDIIMAVTSENIKDVCKCIAWLGDKKIAVSGHTAIIHHNQNAKYLAYYFHTKMFAEQKRKLAHGTKVIEVMPDTLKTIIIPIPPLSVQQRIVSILDRFDALCHDISSGLPAEIETRKKQYEYYRDKLLMFQPME